MAGNVECPVHVCIRTIFGASVSRMLKMSDAGSRQAIRSAWRLVRAEPGIYLELPLALCSPLANRTLRRDLLNNPSVVSDFARGMIRRLDCGQLASMQVQSTISRTTCMAMLR